MNASGFESAACEAARLGGEALLRLFRSGDGAGVETKGLHDYVTRADREAERVIVGRLRKEFPDHAILAEEGLPTTGAAEFRWVVDPLDGTTNFIKGVGTFAVSVALEHAGELVAGAIHDPVHGETFHACRGGGARLNGSPIRCGSSRNLDDALIATGFPFRELSRLDGYLLAFEAFVRRSSGIRRAGSAALDLAHTACGRYDGFWEIGLARWDIAAGALIVREAGGVVTDVAGGDRFLETGDIVASGPGLHGSMLEITRSLGV